MKTTHILLDKIRSKENKSVERLEKNKVRLEIEQMCEDYLKSANDILTFEALPNILDNVLVVIEETELASKYDFEQESETIFRVKLKEFDIL